MTPGFRRFLIVAALGSVAASAPARAGEREAYDQFLNGGAAQALMRAAVRAYRGAISGAEDVPVVPSPETGRPAGPRDEPRPPDWPVRPVGLALCLRAGTAILACEGALDPPADRLVDAVDLLSARLASRRVDRGSRGLLEAEFLLDPRSMSFPEAKAAAKEGRLDLSAFGLMVEGARGRAFVMPGQAATLREAVRIARKSGSVKRFRAPSGLATFTAVPAGSAPLSPP